MIYKICIVVMPNAGLFGETCVTKSPTIRRVIKSPLHWCILFYVFLVLKAVLLVTVLSPIGHSTDNQIL